ncbi:hypothetical protein SORDD20_01171 [Streptococcus oralis]|nr:hypothetical protein SORDD20_01171 [Streptococcus oralis]
MEADSRKVIHRPIVAFLVFIPSRYQAIKILLGRVHAVYKWSA